MSEPEVISDGPAPSRRRRPVVLIGAVVLLLVIIVGGWGLAGPPWGKLPAWVSTSLPEDNSLMSFSPAGSYGMIDGHGDWMIADLRSGRAHAVEGPEQGNSAGAGDEPFVTDQGIAGTVGELGVVAHDHQGRRLWSNDLAAFEKPRLVTYSEQTVVVADDCQQEEGPQRVLGLDLRSGRTRWQQTIDHCDWHVYPSQSRTFFQLPADDTGRRWTVARVEDGKAVGSFRGSSRRLLDDLQIDIVDDRVTAIGYPSGRQRWDVRVCPGAQIISFEAEAQRLASIECDDRSVQLIDTREGRLMALPSGASSAAVRRVADGRVIGVHRTGGGLEAVDLRTGRALWNRTLPTPGSPDIEATQRYAVLEYREPESKIIIYDLVTGRRVAGTAGVGLWWTTEVPNQGLLVTHRFFCGAPYSCLGHLTYLIR